jgi:Uma2 family endonuclease
MHMPDTMGSWTLDEVHRLPDDGNRYELVRGELFVTPPPSVGHEGLVAILNSLLVPYVQENGLGLVHHPRAVIRDHGSEVEPDLMVRPEAERIPEQWELLPRPILVVEVTSGCTRRRDLLQKRTFYLDIGVAEYWIVDGRERSVRVVRPASDDVNVVQTLTWSPVGARRPLVIDLPALFARALG